MCYVVSLFKYKKNIRSLWFECEIWCSLNVQSDDYKRITTEKKWRNACKEALLSAKMEVYFLATFLPFLKCR